VFYGGILLILFAAIRPWRRLAAILGGVVAFGVVVHASSRVTTTQGTDGLLNTGLRSSARRPLGWLIRTGSR
jgi:hypothetical protein